MDTPRSYPEGVMSWVDLEQSDVEAATQFYGALFNWTFHDATPDGGPFRYVIAQRDGLDAAGIAGPADPDTKPEQNSGWNTYVAVDDAAAMLVRITAVGGSVLQGADDAGGGGRSAICADPSGVPFRLWQARGRPGAQAVNSPGGWNFSDLHAADPAASARFYSEVFGWAFDDLGFATMIRVPGYGDHLQATSDPEIYDRQSGIEAPPGFADVIGGVATTGSDEEPHWHVTFTVADRDETADLAERLGAAVLARTSSDWTRDALIRDPQGAVFTASEFAPSSG